MSCPNVTECACPKTSCPNHGKCCDCVRNTETQIASPSVFSQTMAETRAITITMLY